jgi:hypothetical protein
MDHHIMTGMTPFGLIPSSLMGGPITPHQFIIEEGISNTRFDGIPFNDGKWNCYRTDTSFEQGF